MTAAAAAEEEEEEEVVEASQKRTVPGGPLELVEALWSPEVCPL